MLISCDFIQVCVFTTNHHLNAGRDAKADWDVICGSYCNADHHSLFSSLFTKGSSFAFLDNAGKTFSPRESNLLATNSASPIPLSKNYLP